MHLRRSFRLLFGLTLLSMETGGCASPGERLKTIKENATLQQENQRLEREVAQRDATIALLEKQVDDVTNATPDRPVNLFVPVRIEIASRSGGVDYDGKPGDDGVTVHVRPVDADGDALKVPGRITIQLLDNTQLEKPKVVGVYDFVGEDVLRQSWHGHFGSQHYSLKCLFPKNVELPVSRKLTVTAEFFDFRTGATLSTTKEVGIDFPR